MQRNMVLSVRVTCEERALLTMIAEHLERSESDAVRQILRDAGRRLGLLSATNNSTTVRRDPMPVPQF